MKVTPSTDVHDIAGADGGARVARPHHEAPVPVNLHGGAGQFPPTGQFHPHRPPDRPWSNLRTSCQPGLQRSEGTLK